MRRIICLSILVLTQCLTGAEAQSQNRPTATAPPAPPASSLDARVRAEVGAFRGKVSLFAKNLDTGASYELGADERVRTASTIKVAVMVEA
ncbi:MAG: serine hydrolase, partial [Pyrinomonadaceae bacterium]